MDLLAAYSSDDSDGDIEELGNKTCSTSTTSKNYFNLQNDSDSGDDFPILQDHLANSNNYDLSTEAHVLNKESYGPNMSSNHELRVSDNSKCRARNLVKRERDSSNYCNYFMHDAKVSKSEEVYENNEIFKEVSKYSTPALESEIYYNDGRMTCKATKSLACSVPKYQSKSFNAHESSVSSLSWCIPNYSHLFLTSSFDSTIKIWDMNKNNCLKVLKTDNPVKASKWSLCGKLIIYGGFNKKAVVVDVISGETVVDFDIKDNISSIERHPLLDKVFLVGTKDNIYAFDVREPTKPIKHFTSRCKYVLDIAFINERQEFACSTELVARDSSDKTIMVWDFVSGALLSNQIYCERYTCPCIRAQPGGKFFAAQSNGDYSVMFSNTNPYKMQNKRFSEHKVSGYGIGCDFSNDGNYLASGDSNGGLYIYSSWSSNLVKRIDAKPGVPIVRIAWHPVLPSTVITAGWDGSVQLWR